MIIEYRVDPVYVFLDVKKDIPGSLPVGDHGNVKLSVPYYFFGSSTLSFYCQMLPDRFVNKFDIRLYILVIGKILPSIQSTRQIVHITNKTLGINDAHCYLTFGHFLANLIDSLIASSSV